MNKINDNNEKILTKKLRRIYPKKNEGFSVPLVNFPILLLNYLNYHIKLCINPSINSKF
jgi:hypothetical protein